MSFFGRREVQRAERINDVMRTVMHWLALVGRYPVYWWRSGNRKASSKYVHIGEVYAMAVILEPSDTSSGIAFASFSIVHRRRSELWP